MSIQRIMSGVGPALKNNRPIIQKLDRAMLQKTAVLGALLGSGFVEREVTMIIPGGMTNWEKLYKASTGNFPKAVMDRWFTKGTRPIHEGDYEVLLGSHLTGDPAYEVHPVSPEDVYVSKAVDSDYDPNTDADLDGDGDIDGDGDGSFWDSILGSITG